ncbi:MAG: ASPIC/UnbV domain-containing protein [Gemmataceae bacterium]|nr:ASPIC/UnbV domain-containing protein [Gemmataceae bacterium]
MVGARLTAEVGGRTLTRFATAGGSYLSSGDRRLLVGLGSAEAVGRVRVVWPWGQEDRWDGLAPDRYWTLTAGGQASAGTGGPGG